MAQRCEGLPGGPCPNSVCDGTVKFTVYDLFLCQSCESIRDESSNTKNDNKARTNKSNADKDKKPKQPKPVTRSAAIDSTAVAASAQTVSQKQSKKSIASANDDDGCDESSCPSCFLVTASSAGQCIRCDICNQFYHQKCTTINKKTFEKFILLIDVTGWVCDSCKQLARSVSQRLETAIARLAEDVATLKCDISDMKTSAVIKQTESVTVSANQTSTHSNTHQNANDDDYDARTTLIVQRALNDVARRKRNVVVCGMPEINDSDDRTEFLKLCEDHLTVKPAIADNCCIRLGKKSPGKPRQLLIKLHSEEAANSLIQSAPLLRHSSTTRHIYINADLSPAAAKLAFEARKSRREARSSRSSNGNSVKHASVVGIGTGTRVTGYPF
jgi:hypothetical protein